MLTLILKRFLRAPLVSLGVVLLAAILSCTLCALNDANVKEQARYEQTMRDVKVELVVTNLTGTNSHDLNAPSWVTSVFTSKHPENTLMDYVEDVQYSCVVNCNSVEIGNRSLEGYRMMSLADYEDSETLGTVTYFDGWSVTDIQGKGLYGLIPASLVPEDWDGKEPLEMLVTCMTVMPGPVTIYRELPLTVIGTHSMGATVIVSYSTVRSMCNALGFSPTRDSVSAKLRDSSTLEVVRELSKTWFAEPNLMGQKTPWDYSFYYHYPYALRIDDSLLVNAEQTLKISLLINELCALIVFALSAAASFFVGFLMIRSRKREILLMRTLGTPVPSVFVNFALEQLLCLAVGILAGGAVFGYEPPERLLLFAGVYATGLILALGIFLRKNLMSTLKEDES